MPGKPSKILLDFIFFFFLGNLHHFSEPNVENDCGVKNVVLLKDVVMSVFYPVSCLHCTFRCFYSGGTLPYYKCITVSRR